MREWCFFAEENIWILEYLLIIDVHVQTRYSEEREKKRILHDTFSSFEDRQNAISSN